MNDPTGRDFCFLLTRPVPSSAIFIAKSLFLTVFIVLPAGIIHELVVARVGVSLLLPDHVSMLLETAISTSYKLSLVVLLCIFFRIHPREIATAVALGGIAILVDMFILIPQRLALQAWGNETKIWLGSFSDLLFEFLIVVCVLVTAIIRYRTKRYWLPIGVAMAGMTLSLVLWLLLIAAPGSNLYLRFKVKESLTAEQWSRIRVDPPVLTKDAEGHNFYDSSFDYKTFQGGITMRGLPASCFGIPTRCQTVATLRSGKRVPFDTQASYRVIDAGGAPGWWDMRASNGETSIPPAQMAVVAGVSPKYSDPQLPVSLFSYGPKSLQGEDLTGVRLEGRITVRIYRAYLEGAIPLRSGQALLTPRNRYTIADTYFSKNDVQFGYESLQVPLTLRGESMYVSSSDMNQNLLVVYRPFNEALQAGSGGCGGGINNNFVKDMSFNAAFDTMAVDRDPNWKPLPPDWASGAELVFISSEPCGQITIPYEIDNVDLEH